MPVHFLPGGVALAAAAQLAGFTRDDYLTNVTDCKGNHWSAASELVVSLAICQAESSGNAFAVHRDSPTQIDLGAWQCADSNGQFSDSPDSGLHWWDFADNAAAAYDTFVRAGRSFHPWSSFNNVDTVTGVPRFLSWRDPIINQSRIEWAFAARVGLDLALQSGKSLQQLVTINLETSM